MPLTPNRTRAGMRYTKAGRDLHGVENRADDRLEAIAEGSEYADWHTKPDCESH